MAENKSHASQEHHHNAALQGEAAAPHGLPMIPSLTQYRAHFPVGQNPITGLWGWRRSRGRLNLRACRFGTQDEAEYDCDTHYPALVARWPI
jgi:hypothetical protein